MTTQTNVDQGTAGCCVPSGQISIDGGIAKAATVFKALSDATRLQLLRILATAQAERTCVCNLTGPVGLSQPTVSHHLKVLVDAGLVGREQHGKWAYYTITPEAEHIVEEALAAALPHWCK
jgi:ArsR family transcriptional regulator